jgi:hypothetical protein
VDAERVVIKEAGAVVEDEAVDLARGDERLQRVTQRVVNGDHDGDDETTGTPDKLWHASKEVPQVRAGLLTAVTVSMQSTKESCVR